MTMSNPKRFAVEWAKRASGVPRQGAARSLSSLSASEFEQYQLRRLHRQYLHAKTRVPHYRDCDDYPPSLGNPVSLAEALAQLPILAKQTVKTNARFFPR